MNNSTPKAVLFDFDGVIVNSFSAHKFAWALAFEEIFSKEICPFPPDLAGKAPAHIAEYYANYGGDISKAEKLKELKHVFMLKGLEKPVLLPGVREITSALKSRDIPYGIASNASKHYVKKAIEWLDIDFEISMGYQDYPAPKPDPIAYQTLANKLGVKPEEYNNTWVFEDSKTGIGSAVSNKMIAYGIKSDEAKVDLSNYGATQVFAHLGEACQKLFGAK